MEKDLFIKPKDLSVKLSTKNNLKILDATFYLQNSDLIDKDEYDEEHIKNSTFFDINKIAEQSSDLPHMFPSELFFSKMVGKLGINNEDTLVA